MSELNVGPDACPECKAPMLRLCWSEQSSSPVVRHEQTLCLCCTESRLAKLEGGRAAKSAGKEGPKEVPAVEAPPQGFKTVETPAGKDHVTAEPYENWTLVDLHAEATARDIHGRSQMDKAELVKALAKGDKAEAKAEAKTEADADKAEAKAKHDHGKKGR